MGKAFKILLSIMAISILLIGCGKSDAKINDVQLWNDNGSVFAKVELKVNYDKVDSVVVKFVGYDKEKNIVYENSESFSTERIAEYCGTDEEIFSVDAEIVDIVYKE